MRVKVLYRDTSESCTLSVHTVINSIMTVVLMMKEMLGSSSGLTPTEASVIRNSLCEFRRLYSDIALVTDCVKEAQHLSKKVALAALSS